MAKKKVAKRASSASAATRKKALSKKKTPARKKATKRKLINTGRDKRYVRRDSQGKFNESDDMGRSLAQDRRQHAKTAGKPGQGDKGDRAAKNKSGARVKSRSAKSVSAKSVSASSKTTTDHDEIRSWVEKRGGKPVSVEGTSRGKGDVGVLRIDFPGGVTDPPLEPISWEDFFEKFDEAELAMVYQDKTANGKPSHFCKFVSRENAA